jgi:excisionase family DNA binding protein
MVPIANVSESVGRWLSIAKAADYSSLAEATLRRLVREGRLTAHRPVSGRMLIDIYELDELMLASAGAPAGGRGRSRHQVNA